MNMPWSKVRQMLEQDFLCDSLKGRVRYFNTRYNKAHDQTGRVCILVDDIEILNMPCETEYKMNMEVDNRKNGTKKLAMWFDEVTEEYHENGIFAPWDFGDAVDEFFKNSIEQSLISDNLLVRLLAILDRRVGKRTLKKFKPTVNELPKWLKYFYKLRFDSEGLT